MFLPLSPELENAGAYWDLSGNLTTVSLVGKKVTLACFKNRVPEIPVVQSLDTL